MLPEDVNKAPGLDCFEAPVTCRLNQTWPIGRFGSWTSIGLGLR